MTILLFLIQEIDDEEWKRACDYISEVSELSYLTQIVLMQYEDPMADLHSDRRFHVELYFSPGLKTPDQILSMSTSRKEKKDKRKQLSKLKSKTEDDYESRKMSESKAMVSSSNLKALYFPMFTLPCLLPRTYFAMFTFPCLLPRVYFLVFAVPCLLHLESVQSEQRFGPVSR